jgi:hypothetical protein
MKYFVIASLVMLTASPAFAGGRGFSQSGSQSSPVNTGAAGLLGINALNNLNVLNNVLSGNRTNVQAIAPILGSITSVVSSVRGGGSHGNGGYDCD